MSWILPGHRFFADTRAYASCGSRVGSMSWVSSHDLLTI
jgi:hypothetical protein